MKILSCLFLTAIFLVSCAKEREYKKVYKGNSTHIKKKHLASMCEGGCLYLPMVGEVPKDIPQARPFSVGQEKIVNLSIEKDQIIFRETEEDSRYSQNKNNKAPVLSLEIEHKDYRCKKNAKKKCSREEEENKDKHWSKKKYVTLKKDEVNILETNTMPMNMANLFVKCFPTVSSRIKDVQFTPNESINLTVEKTYSTASIACQQIKSYQDLVAKMKNFTFTIDYKYSIVKLSAAASKDFQVVDYPYEDHDKFGFFTTEKSTADVDNNKTMYDKKFMMNRWMPGKTITFYLDEKFYHKDMASLKEMMELSVSSVNKSLQQEKIPLKIELKKGNNQDRGDVRKSFFTLVKDPLASGVIGYGPSVKNPRTGEILSAHVVVYYGTILRFVQHTYNEVVRAMAIQKQQLKQMNESSEPSKNEGKGKKKDEEKSEVSSKIAASIKHNHQIFASTLREAKKRANELHSHAHTEMEHSNYSVLALAEHYDYQLAQDLAQMTQEQYQATNFAYDKISEELSEATIHEYSKNNMYHGSLVDFSGHMHTTLAKLTQTSTALGATDSLRPWHLLSKQEKQIVIDELLPHVIVPTMIHEIGHTLGLRHNFMGSVDKDNFYTATERKKMKIEDEIPYSSVMDYGKSNLNSLAVLGKYDLAALKFGYKREVELKNNRTLKLGKSSFLKIQSNGKIADKIEQVKTYSFCTDEHAFVNPDCNRFDEGTNLEEIVDSLIDTYKTRYTSRNFRNYRKSFSALDDYGYASSIQGLFLKLRIVFERYISIRNKLGIPDNHPVWEKEQFFKELKSAADKTFDFFVEVIKTPELNCALLNSQGQAQLLPLRLIQSPFADAVSCFDEKNLNSRALQQAGLSVIGQVGKSIGHIKSNDMTADIRPTPTEISVKGIYLDKLMAMEMLMKRELGISSFDEYTNNYLDISTNLNKVVQLITEIVNDEIVGLQEVTFSNGKVEKISLPFAMEEGHIIRSSYSSSVNKIFGLNSESNYLNEIFLQMFKKYHLSKKDVFGTKKFLEIFKAMKVGKLTHVYDPEFQLHKVKNAQGAELGRYVISPENTLAQGFVKISHQRSLLEQFEKPVIFAVFMEKMQEMEAEQNSETDPQPETEEEKQVKEAKKVLKDIDVFTMQQYLQDQMPTQEKINRSLELLSL